MASDPVVSHELQSLHEELSAAQRERSAAPAMAPTQPPPSTDPGHVSEQKHELHGQLKELADAVTGFIEEAERAVEAHPGQSVVGALVVGILIGRLLGRGGGT